MKITKFKHEDVGKDGVVRKGGAIHTDGGVVIGKGEGCPLHDSGCRCSEGFYISIIQPLINGVVEGMTVKFKDYEEMKKEIGLT